MKTAFVILLVVGLAGSGVAYYTTRIAAETPASFRTAAIKRGDLLSAISATGTVEPEEVVDVGAQVVGRIKNLGPDPSDPKKTVDYTSVVHEGSVLANIDDAVYAAQVEQAQASLARARADVLQLQAKLLQAEQEYQRAESLRPTKAIADTDYDLSVANFKAAKANVTVGEAVIKQSEAALRLAKTNLEYTVIRSPVEGVIVDRRVNIGQTVVASLNAPSLFLIAKNLKKMQVWASVNEADIGRIREEMPVSFTVDAYPGEKFRGTVAQIRLNATMTQNVVLYTVVVATDNSNGKLKPYLTASLQFEIDQRKDVLLVPNAALRWKPRQEHVAPDLRETLFGNSSGNEEDQGGQPSAKSPGDWRPARSGKERETRLWVKEEDGNYVRPFKVQVGATDGALTEVSGSDLAEGMEVVLGEARAAQAAETMKNPLGPPQIRRSEQQKGPPPLP